MKFLLVMKISLTAGCGECTAGIGHNDAGFTNVLQLPKKVSVYNVTTFNDNTSQQRMCYPFVQAYAMTIPKSQAQTLGDILWFDTASLGRSDAYVRLSRVKSLASIKFQTPLWLSHFKPVTLSS